MQTRLAELAESTKQSSKVLPHKTGRWARAERVRRTDQLVAPIKELTGLWSNGNFKDESRLTEALLKIAGEIRAANLADKVIHLPLNDRPSGEACESIVIILQSGEANAHQVAQVLAQNTNKQVVLKQWGDFEATILKIWNEPIVSFRKAYAEKMRKARELLADKGALAEEPFVTKPPARSEKTSQPRPSKKENRTIELVPCIDKLRSEGKTVEEALSIHKKSKKADWANAEIRSMYNAYFREKRSRKPK